MKTKQIFQTKNQSLSKKLLIAILLLFSSNTFAQYQFKKDSLDLRPELKLLGLPVRDFNPKNSRGTTCTFFALTFMVEYNSCKEYKLKNHNLSEEYLVHTTNRVGKYQADNASFPIALLGYGTYGMVTEEEVPYADKYDGTYLQSNDAKTLALLDGGKNSKYRFLEGDYTVCPDAGHGNPGLTDTQLDKLKSLLDNGNPVGMGFAGNEEAGKYTLADIGNGRHAFDEVTLNTAGEYAHSVVLVGYKVNKKINGGGYVIFRNCGGETWGDKGYGYMTFNFLKKFTYDFLYLHKIPAVTSAKTTMQSRVDERYQPLRDYLIGVSNQLKNIKAPYLTNKGMQQINANLRKK